MPILTSQQIGAIVRRERYIKGISAHKLGAALEISHQQVQKYEVGKDNLSVEKYLKICDFLQISPSILFGSEIDEKSNNRQNIQNITKFLSFPNKVQKILLSLADALIGASR